MKAILALDQGTTSSRAILFGERANVLAVAQREYRQIYPRPGWVEHDPEEIWSTQIAVAAEAMAMVPGVEVAAIGITNQRETTLLWDRTTGRPLHNAIVWQDRRTAEMCDALREHEPLFRERTGLVLDAYFSGTKLRWLLDRVDGHDAAFGTVDTWLIWRLTNGRAHVTDPTNASRTLLFNIHESRWDDELLSILDIPRALLPEVSPSSAVAAHTAEGLPIPAGIPIAGIAGDQQAALFGQRCTRAGMAKNTYGTGSFLVMNTGAEVVRSTHGLLSTAICEGSAAVPAAGVAASRAATPGRAAGTPPGQPARTPALHSYGLEGSIFVTGAAIKWLRDALGIIKSAADIQLLAASVPDSGGAVFVPAFTGLGAPHWDAYARGTIAGLTLGTTSAHIARAALDAIALLSADVLAAMREDSGIALTELRVDGGASVNDLLMQIQADVAGLPVVRAKTSESTALGAAYLAGLAVGFWSESDVDAQWEAERTFTPSISEDERQARIAAWHRAVARAKGWEDSPSRADDSSPP
ncbi:MAG TPA: glycerol kinase GlpK [Thermoanaerobaculia bacterium]|nr:glycerol kinase GlpK [Thermoanaerobaculia bacterium]